MKEAFRAIVFFALVGTGLVVLTQIAVDMADMAASIREERRRKDHPSHGRPRYE